MRRKQKCVASGTKRPANNVGTGAPSTVPQIEGNKVTKISDLHRQDQKPLGVRDMVLAHESIEIKEIVKERKSCKEPSSRTEKDTWSGRKHCPKSEGGRLSISFSTKHCV